MKQHSTIFLTILLLLGMTNILSAQLSAPEVQKVYGGRILGITVIPYAKDSSLLYITTESANTSFYTTVTGATSTIRNFTVMPGLGSDDNYGSNIRYIAADSVSQCLYFITNSGLFYTKYSTSTISTVNSGNFSAVLVYNSKLFYTEGTLLHFGTLNSSGAFTESAGSPVTVGTLMNPTIVVNPVNNKLYIGSTGTTPAVFKSSTAYNSFSGATTFSSVVLTSLTAGVTWSAFGIGFDGRLFYGGNTMSSKQVDYSDDEIKWSSSGMSISGVGGYNFDFAKLNATDYYVYFGTAYSTLRGGSGTWALLGNTSFETHPNDGAVAVDPKNNSIVYFSTDQGIGITSNRGSIISEINTGVEATQVQDFDMNSSKTNAWLASKSGIRKVSSYRTSPVWSSAMFPNGDGAPYYAAEMNLDNPNTAYVGNQRVYKTTNGGSNWVQIFTAENTPYNFPSVGSWIEAIEVCPYDSNTVFAGYFDQTASEGGLFYSTNAGTSWNQILIHVASTGSDVDVMDIVFNKEGTDTVAYVGVAYDLSSPAGKSTYRLVKSGSTWTSSQDMSSTKTSTGTNWVVTINDLAVSTTGDTVFATGTDAGTNHPVAYYKKISGTNLWTPLPTSGFPFSPGKQGKSITVGKDTIYCAVDHEVYIIPKGGTTWKTGYTYPVGTQINVLYYDDILVGTGTGLYGHSIKGTLPVEKMISQIPQSIALGQNYPNPFNPTTVINYQLTIHSFVTLKVYDVIGREVATLVNEVKAPEKYSVQFDASKLSSGIYFYRLKVGNFIATKKLLLMK